MPNEPNIENLSPYLDEDFGQEQVLDIESEFPAGLEGFETGPAPESAPTPAPEVPKAAPPVPPEEWTRDDIPPLAELFKGEELPEPKVFKFKDPELEKPTSLSAEDATNIIYKKLDRKYDSDLSNLLEAIDLYNNSFGALNPKDTFGHLARIVGMLTVLKKDYDIKSDTRLNKAIMALDAFYAAENKRVPRELHSWFNSEVQNKANKMLTSTTTKTSIRPKELKADIWPMSAQYEQNKGIQIWKATGVDFEDAKKEAAQEWAQIEKLVDDNINKFNSESELAPFSDAQREALKKEFAEQVLGGESFEDTSKYITDKINAGPDIMLENDDFYSNVKTDIDDEDLEAIIEDLSNTQYVEDGISNIKEYPLHNSILSWIPEFAIKANKLLYIPTKTITSEVFNEAQSIYESIAALNKRIYSIPKDIKLRTEAEGDLFKDVYIVWKNINDTARSIGLMGIDTNEDKQQAINAAAKEEGMHIEDPGGDKNPLKKKRKRTQSVIDADKSYHKMRIDRLKRLGLYDEYLLKKREYERNLPREKRRIRNEGARIRGTDTARVAKELQQWAELASNRASTSKEARELRNTDMEYIKDLFDKMHASWLPDDRLEKIQKTRMNSRINKMKELEEKLSQNPKTNQMILSKFRSHIRSIPNLFERAKAYFENERKEIEDEIPIEWVDEEGNIIPKEAVTIFDMVNFYKQACIM